MSHFVANSISISKDFKTFKVKGGDNNCVPRSNYWTNNVSIEKLFDYISGGSTKLNAKTEKALFINDLVFSYKKIFGGDWDKETDYWHMNRNKLKPQKVIDFDKEFLVKLIDGLKNLSTKKEYIVVFESYSPVKYISLAKVGRCYTTPDKSNAQKFSKYIAKYQANKYSNNNAKVEKLVPIKEKANVADKKFMKTFFKFTDKDFETTTIYRKNPFSGQLFEVGPICAKCIDFVQKLEPLINGQRLDLIQEAYPSIKSIGGAVQKFDRARHLILKIDSETYMNIID